MLGVLYAAVVVMLRCFFDIHSDGWASLMVVLLVVSGVQLTMIGVLGEYIWRNLDETRRRPRFIVEHTLEPGIAALDQPRVPSRPTSCAA